MTGADIALERVIAVALERRDRGEPLDLPGLCGGDAGLLAAAQQALGLADQLAELQVAAATHDPHLGTVLLGRYHLDERIGAGAMGVVYRATDRELGRPVAVKLLRPDCMVAEEARARFLREAEVLAAVVHPAVVTVYDRGSTPAGDHFLVMELLHGASGSQWLDRARAAAAAAPAAMAAGVVALDDPEWLARGGHLQGLPESGWLRSVVHWLAQIADGLAAAHAAGVRHRDVKPSNLFVRADGRPVLLDFGIAARGAEATLALREKLVGTPAYLAPELVMPAPANAGGAGSGGTERSDVYGLGATLYTLLTLRLPYEGSLPEVLAQVAQRDPVPAARLRTLPRDLAAVLDRALERDPQRRYPTAAAFAADLRAFLAHRPVSARPISGAERMWRRLRRSREVRAVAAVLLVAAIVFAAWSWRRHVVVRGHGEAAVAAAALPPGLASSTNLPQRVIADAAERARVADLLDVAVAGAEDPLHALVLRAAFRLDHGDRAGAAADMASVAERTSTPYLTELASWYRTEAPSLMQPAPTSELRAAPSSAADRHVAAFHLLRAGGSAANVARALDLVMPDLDSGPVATRELAGMLLLAQQRDVDEATRIEICRRLHEITLQTTQRPGGTTATTYYQLASALTGQKRFAESIGHFQAGLALVPAHFGMRTNLGIALRKMGRSEEAVTQFRESIRLRPDVAVSHEHLVFALLDLDRFDEALSVVESMPPRPGVDPAVRRSLLLGRTELARALMHRRTGNGEEVAAAARKAIEHYEAADGVEAASLEAKLTRSLLAQDRVAASGVLLEWLASQPVSTQALRDLVSALPDELGRDETKQLRAWLTALLDHLTAPQ